MLKMMRVSDRWGGSSASPTGGTATVETVSVGDIRYSLQVRVLEGEGSEWSVTLPAAADCRLLELREVHRREDPGFAYEVLIQGESVYFRTFEPIADAPVSVFVRIPDRLEAENGTFTVTVRSRTPHPIRLADIHLHSLRVLERAGRHPMRMGFFSPRLCGNDPEEDAETLQRLRRELGDPPMFRPMVGFDIFYMTRSDADLERQLGYILDVCSRAEMDVFLDFNTWWGGTRSGPDG